MGCGTKKKKGLRDEVAAIDSICGSKHPSPPRVKVEVIQAVDCILTARCAVPRLGTIPRKPHWERVFLLHGSKG